jgi:hypothetical protein
MSLPRIFQTLLTSVPAEVPYLFSDASLEAAWGREISGIRAFKIGIVWQGSRSHINDRQRSIPLALFSPLSRLSGVQLFSLQKGGCEQIGHPAEEMALIDLGSKLYDFMDTAAAVKNLDLIITVDTSIAHLAGGLGAPVWVALPFSAEWRWLLHREDSPWYPTMRLFRQTRPGEWGDVFRRMVTELSRILTDRPVATSRRTARMPRNPQTYSSERSGLYTRRRREGRL